MYAYIQLLVIAKYSIYIWFMDNFFSNYTHAQPILCLCICLVYIYKLLPCLFISATRCPPCSATERQRQRQRQQQQQHLSVWRRSQYCFCYFALRRSCSLSLHELCACLSICLICHCNSISFSRTLELWRSVRSPTRSLYLIFLLAHVTV